MSIHEVHLYVISISSCLSCVVWHCEVICQFKCYVTQSPLMLSKCSKSLCTEPVNWNLNKGQEIHSCKNSNKSSHLVKQILNWYRSAKLQQLQYWFTPWSELSICNYFLNQAKQMASGITRKSFLNKQWVRQFCNMMTSRSKFPAFSLPLEILPRFWKSHSVPICTFICPSAF